MSLSSLFDATIAACWAVPQESVYGIEIGQFQVKSRFGVNKSFWRSWDDCTLEWYAPAPPTLCFLRFYETTNSIVDMTPVFSFGGYSATCVIAGSGLGTARWIWMATLDVSILGVPTYGVESIHVQYKNTNVGSIGLVRYPSAPPG